MNDFFVYTGITLIVVGCIIYIYGALAYWKASKNAPAISSYRETLRVKFYRYRITWWVSGLLGLLMIFIASLV